MRQILNEHKEIMSKMMYFRLSVREYMKLKALAQKCGKNQSNMIRELVTKGIKEHDSHTHHNSKN